jgi:1-acyl-sn-glycerol-3-phosphate acyltransferase
MYDNAIYKVPLWTRIRRRLLKLTLIPIMHLLFEIKVVGVENVPPKGQGYLIAFNHISVLEPPFLLGFWPYFPEAVAGHVVWGRGFQGTFVALYGALPVKRGEYDREIMDTMQAVIASGRGLAIAPEGGRSHRVGMIRAKAGVAYLMDQIDAPIIPVGFEGTLPDALRNAVRGKRGKITIHIGPQFKLPPIRGKGPERRASRQANADQVMMHIAALLPPEYHGDYAEDMRQRS